MIKQEGVRTERKYSPTSISNTIVSKSNEFMPQQDQPTSNTQTESVSTSEKSSNDQEIIPFFWTEIDKENFPNIILPYIMRNGEKYLSIKMIELTILVEFKNLNSPEVAKFGRLNSELCTNAELELFNEINEVHCNFKYGREKNIFQKGEGVVTLKSFMEFYEIVKDTCPTKSGKIIKQSKQKSNFLNDNANASVFQQQTTQVVSKNPYHKILGAVSSYPQQINSPHQRQVNSPHLQHQYQVSTSHPQQVISPHQYQMNSPNAQQLPSSYVHHIHSPTSNQQFYDISQISRLHGQSYCFPNNQQHISPNNLTHQADMRILPQVICNPSNYNPNCPQQINLVSKTIRNNSVNMQSNSMVNIKKQSFTQPHATANFGLANPQIMPDSSQNYPQNFQTNRDQNLQKQSTCNINPAIFLGMPPNDNKNGTQCRISPSMNQDHYMLSNDSSYTDTFQNQVIKHPQSAILRQNPQFNMNSKMRNSKNLIVAINNNIQPQEKPFWSEKNTNSNNTKKVKEPIEKNEIIIISDDSGDEEICENVYSSDNNKNETSTILKNVLAQSETSDDRESLEKNIDKPPSVDEVNLLMDSHMSSNNNEIVPSKNTVIQKITNSSTCATIDKVAGMVNISEGGILNKDSTKTTKNSAKSSLTDIIESLNKVAFKKKAARTENEEKLSLADDSIQLKKSIDESEIVENPGNSSEKSGNELRLTVAESSESQSNEPEKTETVDRLRRSKKLSEDSKKNDEASTSPNLRNDRVDKNIEVKSKKDELPQNISNESLKTDDKKNKNEKIQCPTDKPIEKQIITEKKTSSPDNTTISTEVTSSNCQNVNTLSYSSSSNNSMSADCVPEIINSSFLSQALKNMEYDCKNDISKATQNITVENELHPIKNKIKKEFSSKLIINETEETNSELMVNKIEEETTSNVVKNKVDEENCPEMETIQNKSTKELILQINKCMIPSTIGEHFRVKVDSMLCNKYLPYSILNKLGLITKHTESELKRRFASFCVANDTQINQLTTALSKIKNDIHEFVFDEKKIFLICLSDYLNYLQKPVYMKVMRKLKLLTNYEVLFSMRGGVVFITCENFNKACPFVEINSMILAPESFVINVFNHLGENYNINYEVDRNEKAKIKSFFQLLGFLVSYESNTLFKNLQLINIKHLISKYPTNFEIKYRFTENFPRDWCVNNSQNISKHALLESIGKFNMKNRHIVEENPINFTPNTPFLFSTIRKTKSTGDIFSLSNDQINERKEMILKRSISLQYLSERQESIQNFVASDTYTKLMFSSFSSTKQEIVFKRSYNKFYLKPKNTFKRRNLIMSKNKNKSTNDSRNHLHEIQATSTEPSKNSKRIFTSSNQNSENLSKTNHDSKQIKKNVDKELKDSRVKIKKKLNKELSKRIHKNSRISTSRSSSNDSFIIDDTYSDMPMDIIRQKLFRYPKQNRKDEPEEKPNIIKPATNFDLYTTEGFDEKYYLKKYKIRPCSVKLTRVDSDKVKFYCKKQTDLKRNLDKKIIISQNAEDDLLLFKDKLEHKVKIKTRKDSVDSRSSSKSNKSLKFNKEDKVKRNINKALSNIQINETSRTQKDSFNSKNLIKNDNEIISAKADTINKNNSNKVASDLDSKNSKARKDSTDSKNSTKSESPIKLNQDDKAKKNISTTTTTHGDNQNSIILKTEKDSDNVNKSVKFDGDKVEKLDNNEEQVSQNARKSNKTSKTTKNKHGLKRNRKRNNKFKSNSDDELQMVLF